MNVDEPTTNNFVQLPWMRRHTTRDSKRPRGTQQEKRLPGLGFLPNGVRNEFIAGLGEFCGTFMFLFLAFSSTQVGNYAADAETKASAQSGAQASSLAQAPNASTLLYIALSFGFSLAVNAWVFFRISGGLFNPAVTFGLVLIGAITWTRSAIVLVAQVLGAIAASGVVSGLFPGPLSVNTTLGGNTTFVRGLFIEMFLSFQLVFTIFILAVEKHKSTFLAPVGIGLSLFVAEMSGVYFTGGSLNPARSFGPCVVTGVFPQYHWIYWLGPFLGALLAVGFYRLFKVLEYETANPGQDSTEAKDAEVQRQQSLEFDEENPAPEHEEEHAEISEDPRLQNRPYGFLQRRASDSNSATTSITLRPALQQISDILAIMQDELRLLMQEGQEGQQIAKLD